MSELKGVQQDIFKKIRAKIKIDTIKLDQDSIQDDRHLYAVRKSLYFRFLEMTYGFCPDIDAESYRIEIYKIINQCIDELLLIVSEKYLIERTNELFPKLQYYQNYNLSQLLVLFTPTGMNRSKDEFESIRKRMDIYCARLAIIALTMKILFLTKCYQDDHNLNNLTDEQKADYVHQIIVTTCRTPEIDDQIVLQLIEKDLVEDMALIIMRYTDIYRATFFSDSLQIGTPKLILNKKGECKDIRVKIISVLCYRLQLNQDKVRLLIDQFDDRSITKLFQRLKHNQTTYLAMITSGLKSFGDEIEKMVYQSKFERMVKMLVRRSDHRRSDHRRSDHNRSDQDMNQFEDKITRKLKQIDRHYLACFLMMPFTNRENLLENMKLSQCSIIRDIIADCST